MLGDGLFRDAVRVTILATIGVVVVELTLGLLFALIFTRDAVKTAPVAIVSFMSFEGINWGPLAAAGLLVLVPVFVLSVFVLRYLVAGLAMGAVKE
jgi:ABC-type glycerol-3-phosphate transport system permease component